MTREHSLGRIVVLVAGLWMAIFSPKPKAKQHERLPRSDVGTQALVALQELHTVWTVLRSLEAFLEPARQEGDQFAESLSEKVRSMAAAIEARTGLGKSVRKPTRRQGKKTE